jgi:hypothetical protein
MKESIAIRLSLLRVNSYLNGELQPIVSDKFD